MIKSERIKRLILMLATLLALALLPLTAVG